MKNFSLRSQRTGLYKAFSLLDVLNLLGDVTNDEILLDGGEDVYNLSSFRELENDGGTGGSALYWSMESPATTAGQDTFYLRYYPSVASEVRLVILNGLVQQQGTDFLLQGREVKFPFMLERQDQLQFIYPYLL
jgi:hypothetical protein